MTAGGRWERHVWTLSASPGFDQHPHRHARTPWPDAASDEAGDERFAAACFFRAERQSFFPVGQGTQQAVFTIRVMLEPLLQVVDEPDKAGRLHASLASMSDAVLAYKGIADARAPLLRWLALKMA